MSVRWNNGLGQWVAYDDSSGAFLGAFSDKESAQAATGGAPPQNDAVSSEEFAGAQAAPGPLEAVTTPDTGPKPEATYNNAGEQIGFKQYQGPGGETLSYDPYARNPDGSVRMVAGKKVLTDRYSEEYGADAGLTTRPSTYQTVPVENGPGGVRVDAQGAAQEEADRAAAARSGGTASDVTSAPIAAVVGEDVAGNQTERTRDVNDITYRIDQAKRDFQEADQLSQEARGQQQQGLAMNQQLFDMLANFDPDTYARSLASEATAGALSTARGAGGGAGARQFALGQAIESAPEAQAKAAQQARAEIAQRQGQALKASEQYGQLATGTRAQDQARADAIGNLGLAVADGVAQINGLDWQLDSSETALLGNVYLALERSNVDWANLDEQTRHDKAMEILAQNGLDQEFRLFEQGRQVSGRDILGGIFTLAGGAISAGGAIGAASARR